MSGSRAGVFPSHAGGRAAAVGARTLAVLVMAGCTHGKLLTLGDSSSWGSRVVDTPLLVDLSTPVDKAVSNATLTADLTEIFFSSDNDIWTAKRSSPDGAFATPERIVVVNSDRRESSPAISLDGLTLWFASAREGGSGQLDIWVSRRPSRTAEWSPPTNCANLNSEGDDLPRPPGNHGLVMPLSSVRNGGAGKLYDIFFASRATENDEFDPPALAEELPHPPIHSSTDPFLTADGLNLFYSGNAAWAPGDIVLAEHAVWGATFSDSQALSGINTPQFRENDPWLSPDGKYLYFTSNRAGAPEGGADSQSGASDGSDHLDRIYRAVLDPPWVP
jgi:hypothetical protein